MKSIIEQEKLARFALFEGLTPEQLKVIARLIRTRDYKSGEIIVREGEIGGELFLLLHGHIEISKHLTLVNNEGRSERDKSLTRLKDSDNVFFGEMSIFDACERSATVTAASDVTLGILNREQLKLLSRDDPQMGCQIYMNIGRALSSNLRRSNRDILKLTTAFVLALEKR